MGAKSKSELGMIKTRERVYKEIAKSPRDLVTLRDLLVKKKVVDSGNKFDKAVAMLKEQGRISVKSGFVMALPEQIKHGTFVAHGKSGYVLIDGDSRQFAIYPEDSEGYRSNERVNIAFTDDGRVRKPFIVSKYETDEPSLRDELPKNDTSLVLGRVVKRSHDELVFIPNDKSRFTQNIMILNPKNSLTQYQDKICLMKLTEGEKGDLAAMGIITEIKGDAGNPIHEYEAIAEAHGANMSWSDEAVEEEMKNIPTEVDLSGVCLVDEQGKVLAGEGDKIVDLRHLDFATVDPATCKDMDDAIYSTYDEDGNLVVYTAVANVSKYVDLNSEIGKRYLMAGFTTYAPNRAYNILPPQLSTGICSLNPNVDRLALVMKTVIDEKTGLPKSSKIMDAVIESKEKYSYEQAQAIVDEKPMQLEELKAKCSEGKLSKEEQVVLNKKASDILWKGFNRRNLIKFETKDEYDVIFNDDYSDIVDIKEGENCAYHKVIEAFMLTANEATAEFAKEKHLSNIYRVHQMPDENKEAQASEFFSFLGIPFDGDLSPRGLQKVIASVKGSHREKIVNNFLVRMQSRAKYSSSTSPSSVEYVKKDFSQRKGGAIAGAKSSKFEKTLRSHSEGMENISHFGLQSKAYSHSTSPIRRIADYVTHYNILAYIKGKTPIDEKTVEEIAAWANEMQDANKSAEREFQEVNSAIYCEGHLGEIMKGYISGFRWISEVVGSAGGVDNLGVIVENESKGIRALIPAVEVLPSNARNVCFSKFGSAIISKVTGKPVIKLCEEVAFKIQSANRITREVSATTDLEREINSQSEDALSFDRRITFPFKQSANPTLTAKRQRMLQGEAYDSKYENSGEYKEQLNDQRGKKFQSTSEKRVGMKMDGQEAINAERKAGQQYKHKKHERKMQDKEIIDEDENF